MRPRQKRDFARRLRRTMTDAEQRLWYHLRNRALLGFKFRRQAPIGRYVADFACIERCLIVEIDGGQHNGRLADAARTRALQAEGYRVLRFWNNDVLLQTHAVLEQILATLHGRPRDDRLS
ncbi:endonuclease domain-containing protein [Lysobacter enzymogenes]|uniref:Endonuclease domain-containing protein n=1 Tax=Lysobacter enzymogenes TaxID=69 RepID=A0A3N2RJ48_LYSEN|nr:endonuclease domain-containing protein [Lysobacter enzymogenes]ROU07505.1 endonuclease domain-containing protein [Lysobacter enzymogenes]